MPDLGSYAVEVLSAYAGAVALLGALVGLTWARHRRLKAEVERVERVGREGG